MKRKQENKTTMVRKEDVARSWYVFDAAGKTLGRFCAEVSKVLIGKHKPSYTPNVNMGDNVIVINADKIKVSGAKEVQKIYRYYTGHIGGMREMPLFSLREKHPTRIIRYGVKGMMPKSRLGKQQMRNLRIFEGEEHPFISQKPIKVEI